MLNFFGTYKILTYKILINSNTLKFALIFSHWKKKSHNWTFLAFIAYS